jgi:hypothetical protein
VEFLDERGTIISIGEYDWYELRCHVCGRNISANITFFKGWEGLLYYLIHAHDDLDTTEEEDDFDFVMRKCVLCEVSVREVDDIEKGRLQIQKIKKEDLYAVQLVRNAGIGVVPQLRNYANHMDNDNTNVTELE